MAGRPQPHLPAAPLVTLVEQRRQSNNPNKRLILTGKHARLWKAYDRARTNGWVTPHAADELAIHYLQMHPAEIWGIDMWATT